MLHCHCYRTSRGSLKMPGLSVGISEVALARPKREQGSVFNTSMVCIQPADLYCDLLIPVLLQRLP